MRPISILAVFMLANAPHPSLFAQAENTVSTQRAAPAMRMDVYRKLRDARQCTRDNDVACADQTIEALFARDDLNSYERAQALNFRAYLEFNRRNPEAAIAAYEEMLQEKDVPAGLVRSAEYSLAQLYAGENRLEESLAALDRWWEIATPSAPEPFVLRAQLQFKRGELAGSLAAIEQAIALAGERGADLQEAWYQLRFSSLWSLGEHVSAADTLESMLELWPKRNYYLQLANIYVEYGAEFEEGPGGTEVRRRGVYEVAYAAGWLNSGVELITLAGLRLGAENFRAALDVLEQNRDRGYLADGDALRALITRAADWHAGQAVVTDERDTLVRNARLEQQEAASPRILRL
jgi:tetratricopeptide (TPR) repeat protein